MAYRASGMILRDATSMWTSPRRLKACCLQFVEEEFNAVFDGQVQEVHVCYNTRELDKLVSEYNGTLIKLQDQIDEYIRLDKLRKKIKRQKARLQPQASARHDGWDQ